MFLDCCYMFLDCCYRITWHYTASGFMGVLAMASATSLIWQRAATSHLCDQLAPGTHRPHHVCMHVSKSVLQNIGSTPRVLPRVVGAAVAALQCGS